MERALAALFAVALFAVVLCGAGCGSSRTPLPPPVVPLSATPPLATPDDTGAWTAQRTAPPAVHTVTLASGITLHLVPRHEAPVVYALLVGRGAHGGVDHATSAVDAVVQRALGAGLPRSLGEVTRNDDFVAARVTGRGLIVSSGVVASALDGALESYAELVEGRGLSEAEIERSRAALLEHARFATAQRQRRRFPPLHEELFMRLYGERDPRVSGSRLRPATVESITLGHVRRRILQFLRPQATALVVVGDFEPAELEARVRARFDGITVPAVAPPRAALAPPAFPTPDPRLRIHPTDDDPRAIVRLVERGPSRDHEDYPAFCVLARLAGGMYSAQLNLRFREERGDTYGVGTQVIDEVDHTLLDIQMVVPVSSAGDAASSMVSELERLSDARRIGEAELALARNVELARRAGSLDSAWGTGHAIALGFLVGAAPGEMLAIEDRIASVTAEDVAAVAQRWVRPEHAPMVILGAWSWMVSHPVRVPGGVAMLGL